VGTEGSITSIACNIESSLRVVREHATAFLSPLSRLEAVDRAGPYRLGRRLTGETRASLPRRPCHQIGQSQGDRFFLALLPTVVDLARLTPLGFVELAGVIAAIASSVLTVYAFAAARARRLFTTSRAVRLVNHGSGLAMADAAAAVAAR
jgi:hypothetical protein